MKLTKMFATCCITSLFISNAYSSNGEEASSEGIEKNILLVTEELGFDDGWLLSRPVYSFAQANQAILSTSFHLYLSCLSERYRGGFFQLFSQRNEDRSKSFMLFIFEEASATEDSLLAFFEFGRSQMGYYPIDLDDYYSTLDRKSRRYQLLVDFNTACLDKHSGIEGSYDIKQHEALR